MLLFSDFYLNFILILCSLHHNSFQILKFTKYHLHIVIGSRFFYKKILCSMLSLNSVPQTVYLKKVIYIYNTCILLLISSTILRVQSTSSTFSQGLYFMSDQLIYLLLTKVTCMKKLKKVFDYLTNLLVKMIFSGRPCNINFINLISLFGLC